MLRNRSILVSGFAHATLAAIGVTALLGLGGCGQTGNLYLPTEPAAANRATLPQSLWPAMPARDKDVPPQPATTPGSTPAPAPDTTKTPASQ